MPDRALYYPTWGVQNARFLFDSLLYWDRLACIVPFADFRPRSGLSDELAASADALHEAFISGLVPSQEEKERVHDVVEGLLEAPAPSWCRPEELTYRNRYGIAASKLAPATAELLREREWSVEDGDRNFLMSESIASILMSEIVEAMSSESMPPLASNATAFRAQGNALLCELGSSRGMQSGGAEEQQNQLRLTDRELGESTDQGSDLALVLARVPRLAFGDRKVSAKDLSRLLRIRTDSGLDEMRQTYRRRVDAYVDDLREAQTQNEQRVIHEHWEQELNNDLLALRTDLKAANLSSITETNGVIATVAGAVSGNAFDSPLPVVLGLGLAALGVRRRTIERRRAVKEERWTSWLFEAGQRGLRLTPNLGTR